MNSQSDAKRRLRLRLDPPLNLSPKEEDYMKYWAHDTTIGDGVKKIC